MVNPLAGWDAPRRWKNDPVNGGAEVYGALGCILGPGLVATRVLANGMPESAAAPGEVIYLKLDTASPAPLPKVATEGAFYSEVNDGDEDSPGYGWLTIQTLSVPIQAGQRILAGAALFGDVTNTLFARMVVTGGGLVDAVICQRAPVPLANGTEINLAGSLGSLLADIYVVKYQIQATAGGSFLMQATGHTFWAEGLSA